MAKYLSSTFEHIKHEIHEISTVKNHFLMFCNK